MRGGRKRSRIDPSLSAQSCAGREMEAALIAEQTHSGEDKSYDSRFPVNNSIFESGSFASRCSVRLINEVVSKFDSNKIDLVKSIGFEGILHFPVFKQFNRKFALWIMSSVNVDTSSIVIGPDTNIRFSKTDVGHVFGIPTSGRQILDARFSTRDAKEKVLCQYLPDGFREHRSIKVAQEIVERCYVDPMNKLERDIFRVAFVVFVVSNLFAPSAKFDYACIDYWNAIRDPDAISSFDWGGYVVTRLLEAVTKLKQDIASNIKFPNITGCCIFLQVVYLDSLKLEGLSMPHSSLPRIRDFPYETMRTMILADRNYDRHLKGDNDLPYGKLREPDDCIYSWAVEYPSDNEESRSSCMFAAWECAVAMANLLNMPLEAAGPLFVAAADFQEQIYAGLNVTGMQAIKYMSVLVSILIPYTRGFSYQSAYSGETDISVCESIEKTTRNGIRLLSVPIHKKSNPRMNHMVGQSSKLTSLSWLRGNLDPSKCGEASSSAGGPSVIEDAEIGDDVHRSFKSAIASLDGMPHNLNVNLRVATAMTQFYSIIRSLKPARDFDLNAPSPEECSSGQSCITLVGSEYQFIPSPWELGYCWDVSESTIDGIMEKRRTMHCDDSAAIIHVRPTVIKVYWRALQAQMSGRSELDMDTFDALIRLVTQEDDELYSLFGSLRWRHFFESHFMGSIMAGSFETVVANSSEHSVMLNRPYDLSKSKLLFFPALVQYTWVCYVWNLEKNVIYVFEPSYRRPLPADRVNCIERICYLLKLALQSLYRKVFNGIDIDVSSADLRIITISKGSPCRINRSGVLCAMFCRCYNGVDLIPRQNEICSDRVASRLYEQLYGLKENVGSMRLTELC